MVYISIFRKHPNMHPLVLMPKSRLFTELATLKGLPNMPGEYVCFADFGRHQILAYNIFKPYISKPYIILDICP